MDNERAMQLVRDEAERRGVSVAVENGRVVWGSGKHSAKDDAKTLTETARRINRENALRERKNETAAEPKVKRGEKKAPPKSEGNPPEVPQGDE